MQLAGRKGRASACANLFLQKTEKLKERGVIV